MLGAINSSLFAKPQPRPATPAAPQAAASPQAAATPVAAPVVETQELVSEKPAQGAETPRPATPPLLDLAERAAAKPAQVTPATKSPAAPAATASLLDVSGTEDVDAARQAALENQQALKLEAMFAKLKAEAPEANPVSDEAARGSGATDFGTARKAYDEAMATAA